MPLGSHHGMGLLRIESGVAVPDDVPTETSRQQDRSTPVLKRPSIRSLMFDDGKSDSAATSTGVESPSAEKRIVTTPVSSRRRFISAGHFSKSWSEQAQRDDSDSREGESPPQAREKLPNLSGAPSARPRFFSEQQETTRHKDSRGAVATVARQRMTSLEGSRPRMTSLEGSRPRMTSAEGSRPRMTSAEGSRPRMTSAEGSRPGMTSAEAASRARPRLPSLEYCPATALLQQAGRSRMQNAESPPPTKSPSSLAPCNTPAEIPKKILNDEASGRRSFSKKLVAKRLKFKLQGSEASMDRMCLTKIEAWDKFQDECMAIFEIEHPFIASIKGWEAVDADFTVVAMQQSLGPLRHYYASIADSCKSPSKDCRMAWILSLASGLDHLHNGLVLPLMHRNINPDTVSVDSQFQLKISDMTKSAFCHPESGKFSSQVGNARYVAPEIDFLADKGQSEYNQSSDIFSAGLTTWFICTGEEPYEGEHKNDDDLALMKRRGSRPDARHPKVTEVTPIMTHVLACMWDEHPDYRPKAHDLVEMLSADEPLVFMDNDEGRSSMMQRMRDIEIAQRYVVRSNREMQPGSSSMSSMGRIGSRASTFDKN